VEEFSIVSLGFYYFYPELPSIFLLLRGDEVDAAALVATYSLLLLRASRACVAVHAEVMMMLEELPGGGSPRLTGSRK